MANSRAGASAGWYPDPAGGDRLRYFDGRDWTQHYSDAQPPGYAMPSPGGGYAVPRGQRVRKKSRPLLAVGLIIVIVAGLFGVAGLVALFERVNPFGVDSLTYMNHVKDGIGGDIPSSCGHREPRDSCMNEDLIEYLGPAICDSLESGTSGDEEVRRVGAREVVSPRNGRIIVYWAITDLCPSQLASRQDDWVYGSGY